MTQTEMILYVIKLITGGAVAFAAILLWSRTKEFSWMCLVTGCVARYAGLVYELLSDLGIVVCEKFVIFGVPVLSVFFAVIPDLFFLTALVILLNKKF